MTNTLPVTMSAIVLRGHGGFDQLEFRTDVTRPNAHAGEVLVRVGAAGVNNTDVNTRVGWYSKSVTGATGDGAASGFSGVDSDGGWSDSPLRFPRIQGADCCGEVVAVGEGIEPARMGERVLIRPMVEPAGSTEAFALETMGSETDGAFAQFVAVRASEAFRVTSSWNDIELASLPCAYSTAEGMLHRAELGAERVLITGASGGVGSAAVQLAKRRGAEVVAVCGEAKAAAVRKLGADQVIGRSDDLIEAIGARSVDVVIDVVAGPGFGDLVRVLRPGGRYAVSGAIGGPLVELDVRDLYLKDLTFLGCTYQPREVFENLVGYVERDEIRPVVAATFPLAHIVEAQQRFLQKDFVGKIVLVPPAV